MPTNRFKEESMGRSRYVITEPEKPHFLTCTVMQWLPLFTRPKLVEILLDCWRYQQANQGLRLYGYVVLENHLHFVAQAPDLGKCVSGFKSFTARQIIDHLQDRRAERLLERLRFDRSHAPRGNAALDALRRKLPNSTPQLISIADQKAGRGASEKA